MEDGGSMSDQTKNGVVAPIMANFPEGQVAVTPQEITKLPPEIQEIKVNGDSELKNPFDDQDDSSECSDVLVIDESVKPNIKKSKKKLNDCSGSSEVITHSNPYFNESIFELSQLHQQQNDDVQEPPPIVTPPDIASVTSGLTDITITKIENPVVKPVKGKRGKGKPKPKLREYAQYLGLQPTVQFKCSKCGRAGFESLTTLQEHALQCDAIQNIAVPHQNSYSGFKLTRKVFLCSACGTYYENWNLYMHMLEFHRRYICLYCLGMFSVLEDLCQHIQTKHNLEPGFKNSLDEFFNVYNEPCYITCCECNKLFSEQDNFFYHNCVNNKNKTKLKTTPSVVNKPIRPENHVTGETTAILTNSDNNKKSEEKTKVTNVVEENQDNCVTEVIKTSNSNEIAPPSPTQPSNEEEEMNGNHTPTPVMSEEETITTPPPPPIETRKVPKLSLKLPKKFIDSEEEPEPELDHDEEESDDSEKLTMELEQQPIIPQLQIAGPDIAIIELELEQPLDKFDIRVLLQKCLKATAPTCIYCNHARKIAVNGKQLGLHAIAEHRFAAIVNSITAEELIPESFNNRIQENLDDLSTVFFNLESSVDPGEAVTFSHIFECFPCRYSTAIHKELYLHNRKMHAKNLLLCIMCKSNFYSYSELVCHLCPGLYVLDYDIQFRCCMCVSDDLPSAFRLMVHLRKRHHVCDVCLEMCHNQYRLSNHVWKHKLHHFCYRCGIAYRNKPDITRHLFWKHGTESVLCKKCLQKKWPHVYHFCVPPSSFACEECNLSFTRAVSLKVHKRIHSGEKKHKCTFEECEEMFISKKLMLRHEETHREPPIPVVPVVEEKVDIKLEEMNEERDSNLVDKKMDVIEEVEEEKPVVKPKVDVYDLPELNLSESDSSDSESETVQKANTTLELPTSDVKKEMDSSTLADPTTVEENPEDIEKSSMTIETIWDNFKNYQANKKKIDDMFGDVEKTIQSPPTDQQETSSIDLEKPEEEKPITSEQALLDHDYCIDPNRTQLEEQDNSINEIKPDLMNERVDHDYCSPKLDEKPEKKPAPTATSSDSSSDSDSSSCSCGSNCSCSSSSSKSSSSSSDSSGSDSSTEEGRRRQEARKLRRKERSNLKKKQDKEKKLEATQSTEQPIQQPQQPVVITPIEIPIRESDLDTTESETDEEFYDKQPQKLAKKLLEEKRNQLLAEVGPLIPNGTTFIESTSQPPTPPSYVEEEQVKPKKKSKSKKRKKRRSERREEIEHGSSNIPMPVQTVSPITLSLRNSPVPVSDSSLAPISPVVFSKSAVDMGGGMLSRQDSNDSMLRASKRIRVRNKFYGYSSDEEQDKVGPSMAKWRKVEVPSRPQSPKVVPPITIKTGPLPPLPQQPQQPIIPQLPQPTVEPISIRMNHPRPPEIKPPRRTIPPIRLMTPRLPENKDSGSDSNDSSSEEPHHPMPIPRPVQPPMTSPRANQPQLYCYCRCPYDEVSEMIGCDSSDCAIEWFHFECVGIMVPPKGQWFCPDCRKKKQQRRELMQT